MRPQPYKIPVGTSIHDHEGVRYCLIRFGDEERVERYDEEADEWREVPHEAPLPDGVWENLHRAPINWDEETIYPD